MPKIYVKTIILSFLLGLVITFAILNNLIFNRFIIWTCLVLLTAILINEKLTIRERWKIKHYALLTFLAIVYAIFLAWI